MLFPAIVKQRKIRVRGFASKMEIADIWTIPDLLNSRSPFMDFDNKNN